MSLQLVGPAPGRGVTGECVFDSDGLPRTQEKPILLKAGASYAINIPMITAVCTDNDVYHDRTDEVRIRSVLFLGGLGADYSNGTAVDSNWIQAAGTIGDADRIRMMMLKSAEDWNRHDIDAFATSYKNSPDILFIGRKISRGYDQMVATYKAAYGTPEKMGTLSFTDLETQPLDANFATVTGHFHLERTAAGGGNADGYFLLVVEHTAAGWKIVRDDSTSLPPPAPAANPTPKP
jgi:ketosteroid isomerase-like protein